MSYDVWLEVDLGGAEPHVVGGTINHTSNTAPMWRLAGAEIADMDGKLAGECTPALEHAVTELTTRPEAYRHLDATNRWGTVETTLRFLRDILEACRSAPKATLRVSY